MEKIKRTCASCMTVFFAPVLPMRNFCSLQCLNRWRYRVDTSWSRLFWLEEETVLMVEAAEKRTAPESTPKKRHQWHNINPTPKSRCLACNSLYCKEHKIQKYCSAACRDAHLRKKYREQRITIKGEGRPIPKKWQGLLVSDLESELIHLFPSMYRERRKL